MIQLADQLSAATAAANYDINVLGKTDFYGAVFGPSGAPLWFLSAGGGSVLASTQAGVFSVSKSIYSTYLAQVQTISATDVPYLNMTSGYDTANGATCLQDNTHSVDYCLTTNPTMGSGNAGHIGKFSYDSFHQQKHADAIALSPLSALTRSQITSLYQSTLSLSGGDLSMSSPTISGGVILTPASLLKIVQNILQGTYTIAGLLTGGNPLYAPVEASMYFVDGSVVNSPAPIEAWYYTLNFWVEPGGQYFWMAGSGGTVAWIRRDLQMGGLVFRVSDGTGGEMGVQSIRTAQSIRNSYFNGGFAAPEHYPGQYRDFTVQDTIVGKVN